MSSHRLAGFRACIFIALEVVIREEAEELPHIPPHTPL